MSDRSVDGIMIHANNAYLDKHYATGFSFYGKLAETVGALPGFEVLTKRYFNEFAVRTPIPAADLVQTMADKGFLIGVPVSRLAPGHDDVLLMAATELTTDGDVAFTAKVLHGVLNDMGAAA